MKSPFVHWGLALAAALPALAGAQEQAMSRGEYVARLGNCVACHSTAESEPFAGGLKMNVPFLGNIYTTNITPDPETGIGQYTFEDFDNAMRRGVARDGHRLYPAMPYPSYAKMTEADMRALYDFFMTEVKPVKQANLPSEIPRWKAPRWPLAVWNWMFLDDAPYEPNDAYDATWNRGAYLVQGLGHCGACHTPRGWLFQERAYDERDPFFLAGAPLDHWSAPSLNGDVNSGLGRWSVEDVVEFMKHGYNDHGAAFGTMVEVVNNSTYYMSDDDLHAMAVYLKSLSPAREKDQSIYVYDGRGTAQLTDMKFTDPGATVYYNYCITCHGADGKGSRPHPPLAGNQVVLDPDPSSLINLTLNGSLRVLAGRPLDTYDMPFFRVLLNDREIADVVTFIRNNWGARRSAVTAEQVATIRAATDPTLNEVIVLRMK
jgi:mono/diheme cytochrome c family protein